MNRLTRRKKWKYAVIGVLAVCISALLIQVPGWREQWLYTFYQNQQLLKAIQTANEVNPFLTDQHTLGNHLLFQDALKQAGAPSRLMEQYEITQNEYPNSPVVLAYYARVQPDAQQRQAVLEKAAELNKEEQAVIAVQTEHALSQGEIDKAYWLSMRLHDGHWYTHALRAKVQQQLGEIEKVREEYTLALKSENAPLQVRLDYARFLVDHDIETESPFQDWNPDERIKEPMAFAYHTYLSHNDIEQVWNDLQSAPAYHPPALLVLAKAALKQDTPSIAEKLLDRASRFEPEHIEIQIYRGLAALKSGNLQRAENLLLHGVLDQQALTEEDHARIGLLLWNAGEPDFAMRHFQYAGTAVPAIPEVSIQLARFYVDHHQCETAKSLVQKHIWTIVKSPEQAFAIADGIEACGELELAAELFGGIIDHNLHHRAARERLARIYVKRDEKDRAINVFDSYRNMEPRLGYCYVKAAEIHLQFGNHETARQILDYVAQNPQNFDDFEQIKPEIEKLQKQSNPS